MMKNLVIRTLNALGMFRLLRWMNRRKVIILYVHGIAQAGSDDAWQPLRLPHATDTFRRQIEIISRYYRWISIDDAVAMIAGDQPTRESCIVLTFDDGYLNNMTEALPIARGHGIVPTFYIPTGFISNRKPFWFDRFDYIIQQITEPVEISLGDQRFAFGPGDRRDTAATYSRLRDFAKAHCRSDGEFGEFFDEACNRLESQFGKSIRDIQRGDLWSATLSEADVQSLSQSGQVTIGSHTVDHIRLDKVDADECRQQLSDSKRELEAIIDAECAHFCYPNGSVNDDVAQRVAESGYASATTTAAGFNDVGEDLYQLRRFHLPNDADETRLLAMLSGFFLIRDQLRSRFARRNGG